MTCHSLSTLPASKLWKAAINTFLTLRQHHFKIISSTTLRKWRNLWMYLKWQSLAQSWKFFYSSAQLAPNDLFQCPPLNHFLSRAWRPRHHLPIFVQDLHFSLPVFRCLTFHCNLTCHCCFPPCSHKAGIASHFPTDGQTTVHQTTLCQHRWLP